VGTRCLACMEYDKRPGRKRSIVEKLGSYKRSAKKRELEWAVTDEQAYSFMNSECHYCGGQGGGIDREDNTIGYLEYNCLPCCKDCNMAKGVMSRFQFINLCKMVGVKHGGTSQIYKEGDQSTRNLEG